MSDNILQDRSADYSTKPLPAIPEDYYTEVVKDMVIVDESRPI